MVLAAADTAPPVPGVVIDHVPASSKCYVGSPSIAILADGTLVASHDLFGPGSGDDRTVVFASHAGVPMEIFPEDAGLILADQFGAELLREAPEHRLAGATRKAMLVRFAQAAAHRLHGLIDPEAGGEVF